MNTDCYLWADMNTDVDMERGGICTTLTTHDHTRLQLSEQSERDTHRNLKLTEVSVYYFRL
jgi:hypothetical protein